LRSRIARGFSFGIGTASAAVPHAFDPPTLTLYSFYLSPQPENAAPDSSDASLGTSTILPITPPFPSKSCACVASARGNRCAISGLIFFYVGQGDTSNPHFHPNFTILWLGALFFNHPKGIGPAVVSDDDARVSHEPLALCSAYNTGADGCDHLT
jgi:hypothetical protein